jgi:hypothetical protein
MVQPKPIAQAAGHLDPFVRRAWFRKVKIGTQLVSAIGIGGTVGSGEHDNDQSG